MIFMDDVEVPVENMLPNVKGFKVIYFTDFLAKSQII